MSGIVGFINLNREPAGSETLVKMCRPLQGRSPDGTHTWLRGGTGLAHALTLTSPGEKTTQQPYSLDGNVWITSDAHLYGRDELVNALRTAGLRATANESDLDLLLLAYRTFGVSFARHLIGDFAIAIWDEPKRKLVCVRDHLGVRPLFYARTADLFVFGSDIDALLAHPDVSDELDEKFIADFLLFGVPIEPELTAYKHVRRLPAAHYITVDKSGVRLDRFWSPPSNATIRYARDSEYSEHFAALFEKAVIQRIPKAGVALELTGGMDSSSIAAVAANHAHKTGQKITAYTNTCEVLIPEDREGRFAKRIADKLEIPLQLVASEDYKLFELFESSDFRTAEPFASPDLAHHYGNVKRITDSGCRVLLTGQLGDTLFAGSESYFLQLIKTGQWIRLLTDLSVHRRNVGSFSGTGLYTMARRAIKNGLGKKPWQPDKPGWLNAEFAERVRFEDRWQLMWRMWSELNDLPGQLRRPFFSTMFDDYEALQLPLIVRHPFSDIRLVEFMMGVPNYMHFNKRALREAMQGKLPAEVLVRPKEGLPGDLHRAKMGAGLCSDVPPLEQMERFMDVARFQLAYDQFLEQGRKDTTWSTCLITAPIALAHWMNNNVPKLERP